MITTDIDTDTDMPEFRAKVLAGQISSPHARGKLWNISRAVHTGTSFNGHECVVKWLDPEKNERYERGLFFPDLEAYREAAPFDKHLFEEDVQNALGNYHPAGALANSILVRWKALGITKEIRVQMTYMWRFCSGRNLRPVFVQRYFPKFKRWNSNSGWCENKTPWGKVMQAVSHYSFHVSEGTLLLCDLQGGFYENHPADVGAIIVQPVFCSVNKELGMTDLGKTGIKAFFANHVCNKYCGSAWLKPRIRSDKYVKMIKTKKSTSYFDREKKRYF